MANKIVIRLIGTLTCVAAVATGWDAEAGRWHHHHRRCCYTAPCCAPACDSSCAPAYSTGRLNGSCCYTTVVRREVIVPACCQAGIMTEDVVVATKTKESTVKHTAQKTAATPAR